LFAGSAIAYAASFWVEPLTKTLGLPVPPPALLATVRSVLGIVVAASGVLGVLSSVMLYQVTSRRWWSGARTSARFVLTAALLGLSTTCVSLLISGFFEGNFESARQAAASLAPALVIVALIKLVSDLEILAHLRERGLGELKRSALLLIGELRPVFALRVALAIAGAFLGLLAARTASLQPGAVFTLWLLSFGCLLGSELFERSLFFRASSAPKMPGAIGP
jgi:formate dehydrogenase iron-sulfur subunit